MKMIINIPKTKVCEVCGNDVLDVVTQDGNRLRINANMRGYIEDPKGEPLYMADGTMIRGRMAKGNEEPDGYAHRRHFLYCVGGI